MLRPEHIKRGIIRVHVTVVWQGKHFSFYKREMCSIRTRKLDFIDLAESRFPSLLELLLLNSRWIEEWVKLP